MEPEWPPLRDSAAQRVWQDVLRPVAAEMRARAGDIAERMLARIQAEQPQLFPDAQTGQEQRASVEASLRQLAQIIDDGADPHGMQLPRPTVAIGRLELQRQVAFADMTRTYRLAQERVWQWMFEQITAAVPDGPAQSMALQLATGWLFAYIDASLVRAEQVYAAEREAWLRSAAAHRTAAIEDILAKRECDAARASQRLRYAVHHHHVGAIAWAESTPEHGDAEPALTDALTALARTVSAESTLLHPVGALTVAGWLSRRGPINTEGAMPALPPGVRIALGEPGRGLEGFRRTHIEASHARRVASLTGPRGQAVTCYRDVAVAALASTDSDHAASFVKRVLGELAADDEATQRVAATVAVYLEENRSPTRAAQRLIVHPNTVSYRVRQAEEILGRTVDTDAGDLVVALALLPMLPAMTKPQSAEL